jgi:hypothetical protein
VFWEFRFSPMYSYKMQKSSIKTSVYKLSAIRDYKRDTDAADCCPRIARISQRVVGSVLWVLHRSVSEDEFLSYRPQFGRLKRTNGAEISQYWTYHLEIPPLVTRLRRVPRSEWHNMLFIQALMIRLSFVLPAQRALPSHFLNLKHLHT